MFNYLRTPTVYCVVLNYGYFAFTQQDHYFGSKVVFAIVHRIILVLQDKPRTVLNMSRTEYTACHSCRLIQLDL